MPIVCPSVPGSAPASGSISPSSPASLRTAPLAERATDALRALIGGSAPGDRMPSEAQLVASLGVGRTTVREAIARLAAEGRLRAEHGRGLYVARPEAHGVVRLDQRDAAPAARLAQLFELRRALEPVAAELAASRRSAADVRALRAALRAMTRAEADDAASARADVDFHAAIAVAGGNPLFVQLIDFVAARLVDARRAAWANSRRIGVGPVPAHREHAALVDAIVARDPAAARRAALDHLAQAAARLGIEPLGAAMPPRAARGRAAR